MSTATRGAPALATLALLAVTAVWGSTFVVVKNAVDRMPVLSFLTWRFALATLAMALVRPRAVAGLSRGGRRVGVLLGLTLAVGYVTQTFGLRSTPATISGFITGLFVVFTPLIAALLLRRPVGPTAWAAVALSTAGLGLLSLRGFSVGIGELLTLLCAVAFALHIVGLGAWAPMHNPVGLAVLQLATVAVLCAVAAAVPNDLGLPPDAGVWAALALTALAATAVGFLVQTWAQAHLAPTRAAVVMTMEPLFAGVFGTAIGGDRLGPRALSGAALVLLAMVLVELGPHRPATPAAHGGPSPDTGGFASARSGCATVRWCVRPDFMPPRPRLFGRGGPR